MTETPAIELGPDGVPESMVIDLDKVTFAFRGQRVPGAVIAKILGIAKDSRPKTLCQILCPGMDNRAEFVSLDENFDIPVGVLVFPGDDGTETRIPLDSSMSSSTPETPAVELGDGHEVKPASTSP